MSWLEQLEREFDCLGSGKMYFALKVVVKVVVQGSDGLFTVEIVV